MTLDELIEAAREKSVTKEAVKAFECRVKEREEKFKNEARKQTVNSNFMARSYNL